MQNKKERLSNFVWLCVYFAPLIGVIAIFALPKNLFSDLKDLLMLIKIGAPVKGFIAAEGLPGIFVAAYAFVGITVMAITAAYILGSLPAFCGAYITGWLAIYHQKTGYIYAFLSAFLVATLFVETWDLVAWLFFEKTNAFEEDNLFLNFTVILAAIIAGVICRFAFRKHLLGGGDA
jgi:hypothetical protein